MFAFRAHRSRIRKTRVVEATVFFIKRRFICVITLPIRSIRELYKVSQSPQEVFDDTMHCQVLRTSVNGLTAQYLSKALTADLIRSL